MSIENSIEHRLALAQQNPALCLAPYATIDVRHSEFRPNEIFKTCCCNLDARTFEPTPGDDPFAEIKQQQLQGQWPRACFRCQQEEQHGGQSERIVGFMMYPEQRLKKFMETQQVENFEVRVKFSNLCNLSCRSCSPTESSTYARMTNSVVSSEYEVDISESPEHWEYITNTILKHIDSSEFFYVHFIGGESFIQPGMTKLIDWMIEQNIASKAHIRLTTALTVNPSWDIMNKMAQFRTIDINISMDSVGENYQYVRWPAKFEKVQTNLNTLIEHGQTMTIKRGKKIWMPRWNCVLTPVFSLNNIFYIDQWIDHWCEWFDQRNVAFLISPISLIERTWHLDVEALPIQYRAPLIAVLKDCARHEIFVKYPEHTRTLYSFIQTTIDELESMPERSDLWRQFLIHTAYFDSRTRQSFAVLNSRLYDLLDNTDREVFEQLKAQVDTTQNFEKQMIFLKNIESK